MKHDECELENRVISETLGGGLSAEIKAHVAVCPVCAETAALQRWMVEFRNNSPVNPDSRLPSYETIWENAFKTEVSPRSKALERKAMLPIMIFQSFAVLVAVAVVAMVMIPNLGVIENWLNHWIGMGGVGEGIMEVVRSVTRSFSYLLLPLGIGITSVMISGIVMVYKPGKNY